MRSDIPFALNIPCQLKCLGTIVDCMKDPSKCVSDDTCLERILRIFLQVLVENPEGGNVPCTIYYVVQCLCTSVL